MSPSTVVGLEPSLAIQMTVSFANQISGNPMDALAVFGPLDADRVARLLAPTAE